MSATPGTLSMVGFSAGGLRFAIEASAVAAMLPPEAAAESFAALLGLSPTSATTRVLAVRQGTAQRALLVEEPVATMDLPLHAVQPLPPLLEARLERRLIRAMSWDDQGPLLLVALAAS